MKIDFPLAIKVSESQRDEVEFYDSLSKLVNSDIIVFTGYSFSYDLAMDLVEKLNFKPAYVVKIADSSIPELDGILDSFGSQEITILAIGGGKVCDVAKRVAYTKAAELILYPTIVANDGLLSPIAVISDNGTTFSLPAKMPDHVYIDLSIIRSAPSKFVIAAAFDLLSNISATKDWQYAAEKSEESLNHLAFQLSRMAAYQLLDCVSWELTSDEFLRSVIHGQILSAIAMAYAGSSRPCSGSEHLISHALDKLNLGENLLHGQKVGRATLFTTYLQGNCSPKVLELFKEFKMPRTLVDEYLSEKVILQVFECSRTVRPGRKTIIDNYSNEELLQRYNQFQSEELIL